MSTGAMVAAGQAAPPDWVVTRVLDQAAQFRGLPAAIRTDQGPEFTGRALDQWAYCKGVQLKLIAPGKPTERLCKKLQRAVSR